MKKLLLCLAVLLLSGCGKLPFDLPFTGSDAVSEALPAGEKTPPAPVVSGVSPQARVYLAEAGEYWTASGECTDPERAAALLDKAIEADPLDPSPYLLRSRALSDLGYLNEAFDDATKAIRLSPTAEAYATRGLVCLKQHQPEGARRDFSYAEKLDAGEPLIYIYRAAGAFLDERTDDACDDLERACRLGRCLPWETAKKNRICR